MIPIQNWPACHRELCEEKIVLQMNLMGKAVCVNVVYAKLKVKIMSEM